MFNSLLNEDNAVSLLDTNEFCFNSFEVEEISDPLLLLLVADISLLFELFIISINCLTFNANKRFEFLSSIPGKS